MKMATTLACLSAALAGVAQGDERADLETALTRALEQGTRAQLTEENQLPESGPATEAALLFLIGKNCVKVATVAERNVWTIGKGCGGECHIGPFTSPFIPGNGLICRVARQTRFEVISYTPPAADERGALRTRLEYRARLVDVAHWTEDPRYVEIWNSYGLNFTTFHAFADMVRTDAGWIPYE
ncbi:MAG: hypothetical protein ACRETU_05380 [Steroidobacterales bacterium]